jgi:hypothetical protein
MSSSPTAFARQKASSLKCGNSNCPWTRSFWMRRLRQPKGLWLNDSWYCTAECFEEGARQILGRFSLKTNRGRSTRYRLPLGLLLLSKGLISNQHLQEALKAQRESHAGRLGEWLRQQGLVTEEQLTGALGVQWGLPVFRLTQTAGFAECAGLAPLPILEASRMALVHFMPNSRALYVAFSDGIDFTSLRALEQILQSNTQPCVIGEAELAEALDEFRRLPRPSETILECPKSVTELAATAADWVESNKAEKVRVAISTEHLWLRLENAAMMGHLLFRLPDAQPRADRLEL